MRWFTRRPYKGPATLVFTKLQSGQSPLAIAFEYEEEHTNNYWACGDRLYELRGEDFIHVPTLSLAEFIAKGKDDDG